MSRELSKRYGLEGSCTRAQVSKTAADDGIAEDIVPYLCWVFLSDSELTKLRLAEANVNWEEVQNRAERLYRGLVRTTPTPEGDGFRESWKGINGI
jgi:hypothetical protein